MDRYSTSQDELLKAKKGSQPADPSKMEESRTRTTSKLWGLLTHRDSEVEASKAQAAAFKIQQWWRSILRSTSVALNLARQAHDLNGLAVLFTGGKDQGFQEIMKKLQEKGFVETAARFLKAIPRIASIPPETGLRPARAFLSTLMIHLFPHEVLFENDDASTDSLEAKMLCLAASMLVKNTVNLIKAVDDVAESHYGSLAAFRNALGAFQFARRFHSESLSVWQLRDASRLAMELLTPYGQAYASLLAARHAEDERYITAAERQLGQIRAAMGKLVGSARAERLCKRVEDAVAEGNNYIDLGEEKEERVKSPTRTRFEAEAEKKGSRSPRGGSPSRAGFHASSPAASSPRAEVKTPEEVTFTEEKLQIPHRLTKLLRNEMLAHEIILNPEFKLEDRSKGEGAGIPDTPEAHAMRQIKETMQRIFWDRLVFSLTPADQEKASDFQVGCVAHVRYNGPQGSFFRAAVEKVNEDGSLDVMYPEDGIREQGVPVSRCRLKGDPLDYRPLLALLEEVRDKLIELTPNRGDLAAQLRDNVDTDLLRQMLEQGVFNPSSVWALIGFLIQRVIALEAPVRAAQTQLWFESIQTEAGAASGSVVQLIPKLPEVFQYLFDKVDEIKRDIANAHVDMIRPFLAHHGIAYERLKFRERLQSGELTLANTRSWLSSVLSSTSHPVSRETLAAIVRGGAMAHRQVLVKSFLHLIRMPVRLDSPAACLPEILTWDGRRLAGLRDELDRLSLVAVYSTLLRQFLAQSRVLAPATAIETLETRLHTVLQQDDGVKLDHLVDECQEAAKRLFAAQGGRVMTAEQVAMLRGLLSNAASPTNPVFTLMFGRLLEVLGLYMQGQSSQAEETVARYNFRPFAAQLKKTGTQLHRVFHHNMEVHGALLSALLKEEAIITTEGSSEGKA